LVALALVPAAGCAPKQHTAGGRPIASSRQTANHPAAKASAPAKKGAVPPVDAPTLSGDTCDIRLHELAGPLLEYYVLNHRLPQRLEELAPFAEAGTDFQLTCPVSGQPYVYAPAGLTHQGSARVLLVYDRVPAHKGVRWGLLVSPAEGDQPLSTWVQPLDEKRFRQYVPK
jgi:hypothetical protein